MSHSAVRAGLIFPRLQILAKADMRIVALYDQQLVHGEGEEELGRMLRQKFCETQEAVLQVPRSPLLSF